MDVYSILHIDCKHENLGANDNDLIKTDSIGLIKKFFKESYSQSILKFVKISKKC
jgi:hypothetical protein